MEFRLSSCQVFKLLTALSRLCRVCNGFGTSILVSIEQYGYKLLRGVVTVRVERLVNSDWAIVPIGQQHSLEKAVEFAKNVAESFCEASAIRRCIQRQMFAHKLNQAVVGMRKEWTSFEETFFPGEVATDSLLDLDEQRRAIRLMNSIDQSFDSHERVRDKNVRDLSESNLYETIDSCINRLHHAVLARQNYIMDQHNKQQEQCKGLFQRMKMLGIDRPILLGDHQHQNVVRLEPLAHSPRMIDRKQAKIDPDLQHALRRYESIPSSDYCKVMTYNDISNQNYKVVEDGQGIEISRGSNKMLPQRNGFDEFHQFDVDTNGLDHDRVLRDLIEICRCNITELVDELVSLETKALGFSTSHLQEYKIRFANSEQRKQESLFYAWVRLAKSPDKFKVSVSHAKQQQRRHEDDDKEKDEQMRRKSTIERDDKPFSKSDADFRLKQLNEQIYSILNVDYRYVELYNETKGMMPIKTVLDISPFDCIVVDATKYHISENLNVNVAKGEIDGAIEFLSLHLDEPKVVQECCTSIYQMLTADDFLGKNDPLRQRFVDLGGISLLLSIPRIFQESKQEDAIAAALVTLSAIASWGTAEAYDILLEHETVNVCVDAVGKYFRHAEATINACAILAKLARSEKGRQQVGHFEGLRVVSEYMLKCPVRRTFAPAQLYACQLVASALVDSKENAAQFAQLFNQQGVQYLCEVTTRVPGNVEVFTSSVMALARLSTFEPDALLVRDFMGLKNVYFTIRKFPDSETIAIHGMTCIAQCLHGCPKKIQRIIESANPLPLIQEVFHRFQTGPESDVHWRCNMALSNLVRRKRFTTPQVLNAMLSQSIHREITAKMLGSSENPKSLIWMYRFLRHLVRSCQAKPVLEFVETDKNDQEGAFFGTAADDLDIDSDEESEEARITKVLEEQLVRQKGESLQDFIRRQKELEAKQKEIQQRLLELETAKSLPPLEVRDAWSNTLKALHNQNALTKAIQSLKAVSHDPVGAREGMHLFMTWFQVEPEKMDKVILELIPWIARILYNCRNSPSALAYLCEALHMLGDRLNEAIGKCKRIQRDAEQKLREEAGKAREKQDFAETGFFAMMFEAGADKLKFNHVQVEYPLWVLKAVNLLETEHIVDQLEAAAMACTDEPPNIQSCLNCLRTSFQKHLNDPTLKKSDEQ